MTIFKNILLKAMLCPKELSAHMTYRKKLNIFYLISAICNYDPKDCPAQVLALRVGETVHILEQFAEGSEGKP